jgi:hypothetical protein
MGRISEGTWARLSALGLIVVLGLIVATALAGRPPDLRPAATFPPGLQAVQAELTEAPDPTSTAGPSASAEHRHRILGEDGIFGLPGWPWRAPEATATR